ncbi:MAG: prephenate dehydratase [Chloroflexota bacterium]|nr:prephenate dehydratase [Chloroflexota bacterium]
MTIRAAFQGEPGAYSEQALREVLPGVESVPAPVLRDVFDLLVTRSVDLIVVPVENSQAGSINETYDLLLEHSDELSVRGEYELRVRHCLLAISSTELSRIRRAYSHPQALAQTAHWLRERGIEAVAYHDTAGAARWVAEESDPEAAAVASVRAAEVYGLQVLAEGIEDNRTNRTRFLVVGRKPLPADDRPGKTSLVFSAANRPGALYQALGCLAAHGINLTKLESRPSRTEGWEYVFYVDCSGWASAPPLQAALDALRTETSWIKVLGSYPASIGSRI